MAQMDVISFVQEAIHMIEDGVRGDWSAPSRTERLPKDFSYLKEPWDVSWRLMAEGNERGGSTIAVHCLQNAAWNFVLGNGFLDELLEVCHVDGVFEIAKCRMMCSLKVTGGVYVKKQERGWEVFVKE
jgi:hypothetical protein